MEQNRGSITAAVTAYVRAYHAIHDDPKIFDDFLAPRLFTDQESAFMAKSLASILSVLDPGLAAAHPDEASALACVMRLQSAPVTLTRSRYAEATLDQAVAEGTRQYVILGAGLDTFAFRKPEMLATLQVFEVDHPATQADKRRRVAAAGWAEPAALHWVPVDFAKQDLAGALLATPYDPRQKSFFSWLGVTYYLTRDQVNDTLRVISTLAPAGTQIVFDYHDLAAFDPEHASKTSQGVQQIVKTAGEPMKTGFDPDQLAGDLAPLGWQLVEDLGPAELEARYFSGRTDGYHALDQTHLARAVVA